MGEGYNDFLCLQFGRVLRRALGPKWEKVTGGWKTLHNEELHNF
jgi:hypothetical protein